jgi:hypothetical protein
MRITAMEPFTLVLWLMMGQRFEETRIENINRAECKRVMAILGDRAQVKAMCIVEAGKGRGHARP